MHIDVLGRINPRGLRRIDDSRRNRRVCDAAAAAMIKGPPGLYLQEAWGQLSILNCRPSSKNLDTYLRIDIDSFRHKLE